MKTDNIFPFDFDFVIGLDMPDCKVYKNCDKNELQTDCPFCSKGRGKLYINKQKETYFCQHCKDSGGMLKFHMKMKNLHSTKEAMRDLVKQLEKVPASQRTAMEQRQYVSVSSSTPARVADVNRRNDCYKRLISNCGLSIEDRQDLHNRGLTDEAIHRFGIVSTPVLTKTIAENMLVGVGVKDQDRAVYLNHYINDFSKNGSNIPGLYPLNGSIRFVRLKAGIMIPVVNREGKISMMQIRYHNLPDLQADASEKEKEAYKKAKESYHKYAQLSSGYLPKGCSTSGIEKVHHVGFNFLSKQTPAEVCLTEGCLKADVASFLEGSKPYLAILGVNNTKELEYEFKWLKQGGTCRIRIRFDMDFVSNDAVKLAIYEANLMAQKQGYKSVIIEPKNPSKHLKEEFDSMIQILKGINKKIPLSYTIIHSKEELKKFDYVVVNDLWNGEVGKGIDDYLKNKN